MGEGVNIEIGKDSTFARSPITMGDISGRDLTKIEIGKGGADSALIARIVDEINNTQARIRAIEQHDLIELKERTRTIEQYIAGSALGEPGLTLHIKELKADIKRIETDLEAAVNTRIANMEALLIHYTRNNVSIDKWVFLGVVALLFLAIPATFLFVWISRGG